MIAHTTAEAQFMAAGVRIGRYEIIRRLAIGGMAEILLARATGIEGFEKLVVLKRILPHFAVKSEFVEMFLDEARLSASLEHPNIAQVYDVGQVGSSYYFTMEYIRGEDVRSILNAAVERGEPLPLEHALTIAIGAAAGLHAAHERRGPNGKPLEIVHRDVSPSNVLVSYEGGVKLVDFGVAKAAERQSETRTGTLKGKAAYMSPEQCTAGDIDRRSDVFALGILLYELTTCRRLFLAETEFEIMSKIVHEDVDPPSRIAPGYPAELERIVLRALQRDRAERYESAQDLQVDLEAFAREHQLPVSTVGLAAYMRDLYAERMAEPPSDVSPALAVGGAPPEPVDLALPADHDDDEPEIEIEEPPARDLRGVQRRRPLLWAVAAALAAGVGGVAMFWAPEGLLPTSESAARSAAEPEAIGDTAAPTAGESAPAEREGSGPEASAPSESPSPMAIAGPPRPQKEPGDETPPLAEVIEQAPSRDEPSDAAAREEGTSSARSAKQQQEERGGARSRSAAPAARKRRGETSWDLDSPLPPPGKE